MQSTSLNGAPPIQVGKRHSVKEHAAQADASMEPHLFRWGNQCLDRTVSATCSASMEPHLFRWGNKAVLPEKSLVVDASMEPHLFRWGNAARFYRS